MTARFSESQTHLFSKLYFSNRLLWDTQDKDYRSKHKRVAAYRDIASKFHKLTNILLDERDVGLKLKSLRSTYNIEILKMRERPEYRPKLKWFGVWHKYLREHVMRRGLLTEEQEQEDYDTGSDDYTSLVEKLENENKLNESLSSMSKDPFDGQSDDYIVVVKQEPIHNMLSESSAEETTRKHTNRKRKMKTNSFISHRSSSDTNFEAQEDEYDIYGKYIATQLRGMGVQRAIKAQLQIQNIISEHRIDALAEEEK